MTNELKTLERCKFKVVADSLVELWDEVGYVGKTFMLRGIRLERV